MRLLAHPTLARFIVWSPLIAMPFLLNLRWEAMIAPNEEPKWFVMVLLGLILTTAGSYHTHLHCKAVFHKIGPTLAGVLFILFFLGIALGVTYAVNQEEGLYRLAFWCAGGLTFLSTSWASRHDKNYPQLLQRTLVASSLLLCTHFWWVFFVDFHNPQFDKFVAYSRIGHFNFTADVLMVLIPLLTWTLLTQQSPIVKLGAGFCLSTSLLMLFMSGSLGGMGGLLGGGTVVAGFVIARRFNGNPHATRGNPGRNRPVVLLLSILLLGLAGKWFYDEMPKQYREQIFMRGPWQNAPKVESLAGAKSPPPLAPLWLAISPYLGSRTPMWAATSAMVAERPWLGFGTGSFLTEYPGFSKRYDLFNDFETFGTRIKTNPHNVLLQIASENGLPMALLFAGLYIWLAAKIMLKAWHKPVAVWLCGVWMIWAVGLDAQVNHIFFNPASLFMTAVGLGLLYGRIQRKSPRAVAVSVCPLWRSAIMPALVSLTALVIASFPLRWIVSEHYVAKASHPSSVSLTQSPDFQFLAWVKALQWSPNNVRAIFGLANLYLQQGRPDEAEMGFLKFLELAPNHSVALNLLATIQASSGRFDDAERNYLKARRLEPDSVTVVENLQKVRKARQGNQPPPLPLPPSASDLAPDPND